MLCPSAGKGNGAKGKKGADNDGDKRKRAFDRTARLIKKQRDD